MWIILAFALTVAPFNPPHSRLLTRRFEFRPLAFYAIPRTFPPLRFLSHQGEYVIGYCIHNFDRFFVAVGLLVLFTTPAIPPWPVNATNESIANKQGHPLCPADGSAQFFYRSLSTF